MEYFWPIICNPVLKLEASVGDKRWPVGTMPNPLFGNLSKIALYAYILGSFFCSRFPYYPKNDP